MADNPATQLINFGQSVWYDNISREILNNGELKSYIENWGVRGLTSNPTIFDNAISSTDQYDISLKQLSPSDKTPEAAFEALAVEDIADAADLLLPIYEQSNGADGFVSIEVSPKLARDTAGSVEEGRRLFSKLSRPNVMIKIPGTAEGIPAIKTLLEEGINVNVTLLFSVENYVDVANTYCSALRTRASKGQPIDRIRSVASFFVSRVDSLIDSKLDSIIEQAKDSEPEKAESAQMLKGKLGIANSRNAYQRFKKIFYGTDFEDLRSQGGAVQRPLWASTSTKDPKYRDVLYVEQLIGKDTVNTLPHNTLEAFVDHGIVADTIEKDLAGAEGLVAKLEALGVDVTQGLVTLQEEGVRKFADSFDALNKTLSAKLASF